MTGPVDEGRTVDIFHLDFSLVFTEWFGLEETFKDHMIQASLSQAGTSFTR